MIIKQIKNINIMYSGKPISNVFLAVAMFYIAGFFFLSNSSLAENSQANAVISNNSKPSEEQIIRPFNNMLRNFILLAQEVILDTKQQTPDSSATTKTNATTGTNVTPSTNSVPSSPSAPSVPTKAPVASAATSKSPTIPATTQDSTKEYSVNSITSPPSKSTSNNNTPHINEEVPIVEELKILSPKTPVKAYSITNKPESNEGLVQKFLNSELEKQQARKNGTTQSTPKDIIIPYQYLSKKKAVVTNTEEDEKTTVLEEIKGKDVIRTSSEPYPIEKPENYRTQRLPDAVSKKSYNHDNDHLPHAFYNEEYKKILFDSAASGNLDVLRAMVENFGNTEVLDEQGDTPLIYATMAGNMESVLTLTSMGANVNAQNFNGVTPLYAATKLGRIDLVKLMFAHSADIELSDKNDKTPLMVAAEMDFSNIANMLLLKGAIIDKIMKNGNTALHFAASNNSLASINLLITKGADTEIRNFNGYTPLMLATENGQQQAIALLMTAGADIHKKNAQGMDIAEIAKNKGSVSIVELVESEKIRQNLIEQEMIEKRKNQILMEEELEKQAAVLNNITAKRMDGIPLPVMRPEKTQTKPVPKPSFSKEEMEKMNQSGL